MQFYPKYRPILIRQLHMHALNITSHQDLECLPIYTEKGKNVMRFKVHCLIFLFILSSEKFGEIFGVVHPLIHCHVTLWG